MDVIVPINVIEAKALKEFCAKHNMKPVVTIYSDEAGKVMCMVRDIKCPISLKQKLDKAFPIERSDA